MKNRDNEGGAFPLHPDLTARDYFAAAVVGHLEVGVRDSQDYAWWHPPDRLAKRAYVIADAMLIERKR